MGLLFFHEPKKIIILVPSIVVLVYYSMGCTLQFEAALASVEPPSSDVKMLKSYEQREEEYEKARAQIFSQQSPLPNTRSVLPFDLATKSNQRMSSRLLDVYMPCTHMFMYLSCSIFPSSMHHRRAASDTSMFKRVATADLKKDASSNHSSRSATPLVNPLFKLGGIDTSCLNPLMHDIFLTQVLVSSSLLV